MKIRYTLIHWIHSWEHQQTLRFSQEFVSWNDFSSGVHPKTSVIIRLDVNKPGTSAVRIYFYLPLKMLKTPDFVSNPQQWTSGIVVWRTGPGPVKIESSEVKKNLQHHPISIPFFKFLCWMEMLCHMFKIFCFLSQSNYFKAPEKKKKKRIVDLRMPRCCYTDGHFPQMPPWS